MSEYADGSSIADVIAQQDVWFEDEGGGALEMSSGEYGGSEDAAVISEDGWGRFATGFGDGLDMSYDIQDALWDMVISEALPNIKTNDGKTVKAGNPTGEKAAATENGGKSGWSLDVSAGQIALGVGVLVLVWVLVRRS